MKKGPCERLSTLFHWTFHVSAKIRLTETEGFVQNGYKVAENTNNFPHQRLQWYFIVATVIRLSKGRQNS